MHLFANHCLIGFRCAIIAILVLLGAGAVNAQDKWLVLKNDQIIEGSVAFESQRYTVTTRTGSRIVIPESRVSFVADSVDDIYWDKWSRVDPEDPQSHINLFRWCLKHEMLKEAQKQIDLVTKIENMDDQAGHLSRMAQELEMVVQRKQKEAQLANRQEIEKLQIRNLPPVNPDAEVAIVPTIPSTPLDAEGKPMRRLEPLPKAMEKASVALVDFEEEVSEEVAVSRRQKPAWVSNRQLDRETRMMPNGTVSFYKRHIEPKLIENCAACHDSRSLSMPMSRRSFGQTIPRRMSQQNLHFVLEQVNRAIPFESRLLQMATTAHGEQKAPAFTDGDPDLFELKKWTVAVSDDPAKWLMQLSEQSKIELPEVIEQPGDTASSQLEIEPAQPAKPEQEQVDPYDPAGFNRK